MVKVNIEKPDLNTYFRHIEVGNFFVVSDELYIKILCYDSVENAINLGNGHKIKFKNSDEVIRPRDVIIDVVMWRENFKMFLKDLVNIIYQKGTASENTKITVRHYLDKHNIIGKGIAKDLYKMRLDGWNVIQILIDETDDTNTIIYNNCKIIEVI